MSTPYRILATSHVIQRCQERFNVEPADVPRFLNDWYDEGKYIGLGDGNTHIIEHRLGYLVIEYAPQGIKAVTILTAQQWVNMQKVIREEEEDLWKEYTSRL